MRVYDGENLKDTDPKAKSVQEYRDAAGVDEGMTGISTRFAFKVLSETFNYDTKEVAADPVHLMYILEQAIRREQFPKETEASYLDFIKSELASRYAEFIGHEIQKAYLELTANTVRTFRPLYRLCRRLARRPGFQGCRYRADPQPGDPRQRVVADRKPAGIANPRTSATRL